MCLWMAEIVYVVGRTRSQHVSYKAKCVLPFPICFSLPALVVHLSFPLCVSAVSQTQKCALKHKFLERCLATPYRDHTTE